MPAPTTNATVNKVTQIGMEATPGTSVSATKVLTQTDFTPGIKYAAKEMRAGGRKYPFMLVPGKEYTEAKLAGLASFTELTYWLSSASGIVTPVTHTGGTTSKDWTFTPPLTGNATPQTFTVEKGDANRAFKFTYGLLTGFGLKFTRDSIDFSGDAIGQLISDGISLTNVGVTALAKAPIVPNGVNVYLDTTYSGIGSTQLLGALTAEFSFGGAFGTYWTLNRSNASFNKHIDLAPKTTFKLEMEADTVGMSPLAHARAGDTLYIQVDAQGALIEGAIYQELKLNLAAEINSIDPWADDGGVYKIGWQMTVVEDSGLGYAWKAILTNALASL